MVSPLRIAAQFLLASAILVTPLSAQENTSQKPPEAKPSIHVIGRTITQAELRKQANDFVRSTGIANGSDPVARWIEPVCPKVVDIKPEYAAIVETRMREIAADSRILTGELDCKTNITVSFTTDAAAVVQAIATKAPSRLAELAPHERDTLLKSDAPIRWWYNTRTQGADGMKVANSDSLLVSADSTDGRTFSVGTGGESAIGNGTQTVQAYRSTLIGTLAVRALFRATVIIDINLAEGASLDAVASYAAMVAYAETEPMRQPMPYSILGLFDEGRNFTQPTDWDMTLLRTLYSMPHDRAGQKHRRMLVGAIVEASTPTDTVE